MVVVLTVWQEELHGQRSCIFTGFNQNCHWTNGWYCVCLQDWWWLVCFM